MSRNTSITLGEHFARFVEEEIESGRFGSAQRGGPRWPAPAGEHEMRIRVLRQALIDGERSGPSQSFDFEHFLARKHQALTE